MSNADLLAELKATQSKIDDLLEASRGPGRHAVFMALKDVRYDFQDAVWAGEQIVNLEQNQFNSEDK